MRNRFIKIKWLALLTSFAILLPAFPTASSANGSGFTSNAAIINASFDEPLVEGAVPGWEHVYKSPPEFAHQTYYELSDIVRTGAAGKSIKLVDQSGSYQISLKSTPIEIIPGESYSASTWFYTPDNVGRGSLMVRFFKANKTDQTGTDNIFHVQNQAELKRVWTQISTPTAVAPSDAKYMSIFVYISNAWVSTATHYDDVKAIGKFPVSRAADDLTLNGAPLAFVNSDYEVTIGAKNAAFLYATDVLVNYDPTKFQYSSTEMVGGYLNATSSTAVNQGTVRVTSTLTGSQAPLQGNVALFKLKFKPLTVSEDTAITIALASQLARQNADESQQVDHPLSAASISVAIKASAADLNNDGQVNLVDLTLVSRSIGVPINSDIAAYDMNLDGVIDIADMVIVSNAILAGGVE